ncbi:helix-turn-helix domain-containing protein [Roseibium sp. HPY-6]|uniref:GlxA family transcriptional regulator n=1 Tax=Roseibium sp. HPY-6 TaxID=3229852 RepID=UPI00338EA138
MTSFTAKPHNPQDGARRVVFVVYPDIVLLDLVGPLQVFSHALDPETGRNGYSCAVTSVDGGAIDTNTVVTIPSEPVTWHLDREIHTLVVVGGAGANTAMYNNLLLENIRRLAGNAQRVCSVCSGALVLAAAGLLDGRRAVTHWEDCKTLEDEYPGVQVEVDPIFIKDGNIWTSAGITAGIDMALAIVAADLGRRSALQMAQSMVTHMARAGGQSQFSPVLGRQVRDVGGRFETLHQWIAENIEKDLRVEALAEQANMSARNFARQYTRQTGLTPAKAVEAIRTDAAKELLETTDLSVKQVAVRTGFNDEERMRRTFLRLMNVSPADYRQGFRARLT